MPLFILSHFEKYRIRNPKVPRKGVTHRESLVSESYQEYLETIY